MTTVYKSYVINVVILLNLGVFVYLASIPDNKECTLESSGIYISLSSDAEVIDDVFVQWVDVYWFGMEDGKDSDYLAIWDHDPTIDSGNPIEEFHSLNKTNNGRFRTSVRWRPDKLLIDHDKINKHKFNQECLNIWAGYIQDGMLIYSSTLCQNPDWMWSIKDYISNVGIADVFLPGTHDAGAIGKFGFGLIGDVVGEWTFTQDMLFEDQLAAGVRYLDMRISYYENTIEKFYVNHGDIRIRPLHYYIEEIQEFLSNTNDIIIFDVHGLEHGLSSNESAKNELILYLEESFQQWITPNSMSPNPNLGQLWENQHQIIVTFPGYTKSQFMWRQVKHLWGDSNQLDDLFNYINTGIPSLSGKGHMWSAMTEFTPSAFDVAMNHWGGLRGAAAITNPEVSEWVRELWWKDVNIVSMDFIESSNIISIAIEANIKRFECQLN